MTFDEVRTLVLAMPRVAESTSYGAPAFKVGGKLIANQPSSPALREGGRVLVLHDVEIEERAMLIEAEPEVFFFTDHYRDYPLVLVRLPAITAERLKPYLDRSWRLRVSPRTRRGAETS